MGWSLVMALGIALLFGTQNAASEPLPSVAAVLERYIEALGGRAALERLTSRVSEGTIRIAPYDVDGTISIYERAPNDFLSVTGYGEYGVVKRGLAGSVGWIESFEGGVQELSGPALARFRADVDFRRDLNLARTYAELKLTRDEFRNQPVYTVRGRLEDVAETLRFDVDSGLLIHRRRETPGEPVSETTYGDYRSVDGVKVPFRVLVANDEMTITTELKEVRHNVAIDEAKFAKPVR